MKAKLLGHRGDDFLVDAGRGDALGQVDVVLARVYSRAADTLSPDALPVSSIVARGYWEPIDDVDPALLSDVRARAGALLAA